MHVKSHEVPLQTATALAGVEQGAHWP